MWNYGIRAYATLSYLLWFRMSQELIIELWSHNSQLPIIVLPIIL